MPGPMSRVCEVTPMHLDDPSLRFLLDRSESYVCPQSRRPIASPTLIRMIASANSAPLR